jgi:hypothetical protein
MGGMSRLRRLVVSDRWVFITCRLLSRRRILSQSEFPCFARVIRDRHEEHIPSIDEGRSGLRSLSDIGLLRVCRPRLELTLTLVLIISARYCK